MITIYDKDDRAYIIRPCPLINITWNTSSAGEELIGGSYEITLTGTLLNHAGSPIFVFDNRNDITNGIVWTAQYYPSGPGTKPAVSPVSNDASLNSILSKQIALRELFSKKCAKIEVASVRYGDSEEIIKFYPKLISINFAEDIWVDKCDYTITLETQFLLDKRDNVIGAESYATETFGPGSPEWNQTDGTSTVNINLFLDKLGGFIEDFQESWSLEPEDGNGNTSDPYTSENTTRIYRLTRNISAKGKDISSYECFSTIADKSKLRSHAQAKAYVLNYIHNSGVLLNHSDDYPYLSHPTPTTFDGYFAGGLINLSSKLYGGYNHSRNETIDVTQGTYSVQDTWILSSGTAYENYTLSLSSSEGEPRNKVSIQGTIKGLTSIPASGTVFGGDLPAPGGSVLNTAYENAINKYRAITNSGQFGLTAHTYKRAQNAAGGIVLNHIPLSLAVGTNEFTGEITYTIEYDDRPYSAISGSLAENISVTDTYPGDLFAVIPVIGRPTGPVLQYIGGRTEYQRSFSLDMLVERGASGVRQLFLQKPSLIEPTRSSIISAINACSPGREPGIRKYFVSPPTETWDPKEGRYTLNITWTYELNY